MVRIRTLMLLTISVLLVNGEDMYSEEYCMYLANNITNRLDQNMCHDLCTECFGQKNNQCLECKSQATSQELDINNICFDSSGMLDTVELLNITVLMCSESNDLMLVLYIAAGGGAALLCLLLLLFLCVIICCCRRKRKQMMFELKPITEEQRVHSPVETTNSGVTTLSNEITNDFTIQANEGCADENLVDPLLKTSPPPSLAISHPHDDSKNRRHSSVDISGSSMNSNQLSTLTDKGYIKMTSVGSVRQSQSLHNFATNTDDIYVDPDQTSVSINMASHTDTPVASLSSSSHAKKRDKPATLPKPIALLVGGGSKSPQKPPPPKPPPSEDPSPDTTPMQSSTGTESLLLKKRKSSENEDENEDDYESPDIFKQDLEQQEIIEGYYNTDAIIKSLREGLGEFPPESPLYTNVDSVLTSATTNREKTDEQDGAFSDSTLYSNVPHIKGIIPGSSSIDEDNSYVYMKSVQTVVDQVSTDEVQTHHTRERVQSDESKKSTRKYVNFTREQQLKIQPTRGIKTHKNASVRNENGIGPVESDSDQLLGDNDKAPLYVNFTEDNQDEEEELYTELS